MHVVQLGPYPPPQGGVQANLVAIHRYLKAQGVRSSVINLTRYRKDDHDDVYFPESAAGVFGRIAALRPTILHLHIGGDITGRLLALGLACSVWPGAKSVLTFHSGGYPASAEGRTAGRETVRGFVLRRFSRLIAVNPQLGELFSRFGADSGRIRVIAPHALTGVRPGTKMPEEIERFFAAHQPVLISMGWLEPEYDYSLQIRTLGKIRARHPRAGLLILGAGRLEADLRREIAATQSADAVLMAGDVAHEVAMAALERSQVFLRTTLYDGDSVSVREALHLGVPVVATNNGMRPAGVILMRDSSSEALSEGVEEALGRERGVNAAGEDWSNIAAVLELYRELASSAA
jgi:glycogen synthase